MRCGKLWISLLTVMLLILAGIAILFEPDTEEADKLPISFLVQTQVSTEVVTCWEDDDSTVYVFLPGYVELDRVQVKLDQNVPGSIGEYPLANGMSCSVFQMDEIYSLSYKTDDEYINKSIVFLQSGNLPTLNIDVSSGTMDYIHMDQKNSETGELRLYSEKGELLHSGGISSIKGRGNSSWDAEKKPYSLTLTSSADLLGMGHAEKWILLADAYNALNIRNRIVYAFSEDFGIPFTPDTAWVDLYLNGEYAGLYLLAERNEIHPERVDISESSGFLVSLELKDKMINEKIPHVLMESEQALRVHHSAQSLQTLRALWQTVENAILSEDGIDPISGKYWEDLIDLDSWARKFLVEEVFANNDGGALSQYFYRDEMIRDGKIIAGPVWDYDFSMGGEGFWLKYRTDYYTVNREYKNGGAYMPWFFKLYQKDAFYSRVRELYAEEVIPLLKNLLDYKIEEYADLLKQSARMNSIRWYWDDDAVAEDVAYLQWFLQERESFLTDLWMNQSQYYTVRVDPGRYGIAYYAVKAGEYLPGLPSCEETGGLGWHDSVTDEPYDITQPIYKDTSIYMKKAEDSISAVHYVAIAAFCGIFVVILFFELRMRTKKKSDTKLIATVKQ